MADSAYDPARDSAITDDPATAARREACVVGDRFVALTQIEEVQTVSQFVASLRRGGPVPERVLAVQGVSQFELDYLREELNKRQAEDTEIVPPVSPRLGRDVVHKQREPNVLLADLTRTGPEAYTAGLWLHADNELFGDHQTGQHVQGLVIIEAMRQMFIAVFETAYGRHNADRDFYVVWDSIDVTFLSFLFPLPASIHCEILEEDLSDVSRAGYRMRMRVLQNEVCAADATVRFGGYDQSRIEAAETRRARRAVHEFLRARSAAAEPAGVTA
ncbi:hypothetical protein FHR81_003409 [Actinoalloteichus hoggarensis]|uniref:A-factor biosynthesis hotdog domain protein n=1 Tax=Actinoalloteichus hoggarensis TaxID=1470176 RepID=A0A221W707_9PSEU|nr:AfsA-related hotdog domain-containing protein [Actinoalloteichus hoggarensis]ASO21760.1 A-factor biosynthesis hotdog domain protein [Actinoalloteichus hoggarensis]MBB5922357.1 hypothetical protein [Actinoalloteichus hoggarensis]